MQVDFPLVDKIATLARLEFSGEEKEQIRGDLEKILTFVEKLNELDTDNVDPLIYVTDETNVVREDEVKKLASHEDALRNAPKKDSDYFRVPKVIDQNQ